MSFIDINCDLGEGGGNDPQLMHLISSCNIACGGHFGDEKSVRSSVGLAVQNGVAIGAHPSYPDKENFGRKSMEIPLPELREILKEQIILVKNTAEEKGAKLHHVKPHGALYHDIISNEALAEMFLELTGGIDENSMLFAPPHSCLHAVSKKRMKICTEGFADRVYQGDYNLLPRNQAKSVIYDKAKVADQVLLMLKNGQIPIEGEQALNCHIDTICIHGDNKNALEILACLNRKLQENHIKIQAV